MICHRDNNKNNKNDNNNNNDDTTNNNKKYDRYVFLWETKVCGGDSLFETGVVFGPIWVDRLL